MTGSRVRTCVTTPILDTLHFSVNGPSRHAASYAESPVNDLWGAAASLLQRGRDWMALLSGVLRRAWPAWAASPSCSRGVLAYVLLSSVWIIRCGGHVRCAAAPHGVVARRRAY